MSNLVETLNNVAVNNNVTVINEEGEIRMYSVLKLNISSKVVSKIPYPTTAALEWADRQGRSEDMFLIVDHSFDKKEEDNAQKNLDYILANGIRINGVRYVWCMAGSSQLRNASSTFIDETKKDEFLHWVLCGVDDRKNLVANKTLVYRALTMSSTYKWNHKFPSNKFFGLLKMPSIDKVGIFKDVNVTVHGIFDVIENDEVKFNEERDVEYKISDGIAYYVLDDTGLKSHERTRLIKELEDFTFRAPGFKGLMKIILKSTLINWISFNKINPVKKDFWGNEVNILDLEVITFGSVFKWSKCVDNFDDYRKAFKELGHEFRVCVTAHKRLADIPYQQVQTLQLSASDADLLARASARKLNECTEAAKTYKLLSGAMGKAVELYPALLKDKFVFNCASQSYDSKRYAITGGRIPDVSINPFAAPDTIAVLQGLLGLKVEGVIPAHHVICASFEEGGKVDVTRCPHLDNAHCVRVVDEAEDTKLGFFLGSTMFFSCHDATMGTLQMDFDGDHVNVTDNKFIVAKAEEAVAKLQNNPLFYEAKGSKASYATDEDIIKLLSCIEAAPVGLYANTLTKRWANGVHTQQEKEEVAFLTEGANTCIDAAKYISGDSVQAAGFHGVKLIQTFNGIKLPEYNAYAKSSPFVKGSLEKRMKKSMFYQESGLDQYNRKFRSYTSEKFELVNGDTLDFNYKLMIVGDVRRIPGMCKLHEGIFDKLAFANEEEQKKIDMIDSLDVREEMETMNAKQIRTELINYGTALGYSENDVVNCIISSVYIQNNAPDQLKRVMWNCFGDEIVANLKVNLANA